MVSNRQIADYLGVKPPLITRWRHAGMPNESLDAATAWHRKNVRAIKSGPPKPKAEPPVELRRPEEGAEGRIDRHKLSEDGPQAAYERHRQIERASYALAARSLKEGRADVQRLVALHAQASKNLTAAKQDILNLEEREQNLVSGEWVRKVMQEHDAAAASLVRSMPKQLAGRILPHDPEHAEGELERWVQETFLKTLSNTDPWRED
ncbi:MAG TPA: hypothetical protein P5186_28645 [Candidatus Paceibacterota bacterium]|nr:hypothetical protein [Candidatus Paceibacterota bacterium]